jgi:hypothetical protein
MSDFAYCSRARERGALTREICSIHAQNAPAVFEFHGAWGSLAASRNTYRGFDPFEDERYVCVVIGGPVLLFRDNMFLSGEDSSVGTKAMLQRYLAGTLSLHEDLSGPFVFVCLDKKTRTLDVATDLMLFIPVYEYRHADELVLSSHVDVAARLSSRQHDLDMASIADFVMHGVVTYPFTAYSGVRQVKPACVSMFDLSVPGARLTEQRTYWMPTETRGFAHLGQAAEMLRHGLLDYVGRVTEGMTEVAEFLSGGEDSRAVAGMLPARLKRDGYVFLDGMNREGRIAHKVAEAYGVDLHVHVRSPEHYAKIIADASRLVGFGHQYAHVHALGLHAACGLDRYAAVFGGYLADSLLKGAYILKRKSVSRMHWVPEFFVPGETRTAEIRHPFLDPEVCREVTDRRRSHFQRVAALRPKTAHEWFTLWPATMRATIPFFHSNRRLFRSYEPFMNCQAVKLSATVPIQWKLNRRLFMAAVGPFLEKSRWIMHVDGYFPSLPWSANVIPRQLLSLVRKFGRLTRTVTGTQGSWTDWRRLTGGATWAGYFETNKHALHAIRSCFGPSGFSPERYSTLNSKLKMNLLQVLVSLRKIEGDAEDV